jgi:hypothetical protein
MQKDPGLRSDPQSLLSSRGVLRTLAPRAREPWLVLVFPFIGTLRTYRLENLRPDFVAGLTTALFAIPQAMA